MKERLILGDGRGAGGDGLSGVHRASDIPYPRQGPGHGPLLWPIRQYPSGEGQEGEPWALSPSDC